MYQSRTGLRRTASAALGSLLGTLAVAIPSQAQSETYLEPLGGGGGSAFSRRCPAGEYLHGFELRVGDDVDAIRPVCFAPAGQGERIAPAIYAGEWHGGPAGVVRQLHCPANRGIGAVRAMRVLAEGATVVVNEIRLVCGPVSSDPLQHNEPAAIYKGPDWRGRGFMGAFGGSN